MQTEKPEILLFFSYARADAEFALKLATDLRAAGTSLWMDQLDIMPGKRWDQAVQEALDVCPCLLVILSLTSVKSNNVMDEVSFALEQNKKVMPVRYGDCDIPFRLRRLEYIDFTHDYDAALTRLVRALDSYSEEIEPGSRGADGASSSAVPSPPHRMEGAEAATGAARREHVPLVRSAEDEGSSEKPSMKLTRKRLLVAAAGLVVVLAGALGAMRTKLQSSPTGAEPAVDNAPPVAEEGARTEGAVNVKYLNRAGYGLFRDGRYDEAISNLTRAVSLQPDHLLANLNLAKALCAAGKLAEAEEVVDKASRLNPSLASTAREDGEFARICKPLLRALGR